MSPEGEMGGSSRMSSEAYTVETQRLMNDLGRAPLSERHIESGQGRVMFVALRAWKAAPARPGPR